ncbi:MAG TPA: hypothetical protein VGO07_01880 [Candidatus Saccharimonadales bacterium]|nr:hypothetical protein [Candidatus Saccharimonadales bacterium]
MTLIAMAFNKERVCVSTDTQLTYTSHGSPAGEAVKSQYIKCKNGKFLAAYTGNNIYLEEGVHVADWITNLLASSDIRDIEIAEIIQRIIDGLNEKYYYKRSPEALVILIAGWQFNGGAAKLTLFRITNCETENGHLKAPAKQFEVFESTPKRDVVVRGSIQLGANNQFDGKIKHVKRLLKTVSFREFRDTIGEQLYELDVIAHNSPEWGRYIGDKTMLSVIHKMGDGVDYWRFPRGHKDYMMPNFNNGTISIRGAQVRNDPIEGNVMTFESRRNIS